MNGFGKRVLKRLAAILAIAFCYLTRWMPLSWLRAAVRLAGRMAYALLPRVRKVGLANLDLAYGDSLSRAEKKAIVMKAFQNVGLVAVEFSRIPFIQRAKNRHWTRITGLEHMDLERGALLIAAHLGNWEWLAPSLGAYDVPIAEVVRTMDDPWLDGFIDRTRRAGKIETIPRQQAGAEITRCLKSNMRVGILIDQSTHDNGVPVRFFGQPCWATAAPAMIALRSGVPIHFINSTRLENGDYEFTVSPPMHVQRTENFRENIQLLTQSFQDRIEEFVRQDPGQWLWLYRRWKPRPHLAEKWEAQMRKAESKSA